MPHRLDEHRAKIQFVTFAAMPHMIHTACLSTGTVSATRYIQEAVCAALARDHDLPVQTVLDMLPATRGPAGHLADPTDHAMARPGNRNATGVSVSEKAHGGVYRIGPANTDEQVR